MPARPARIIGGLLPRPWLLRLRRRRFHAELARRERPYRLHFGCGSVRLPGWVNVDAEPSASGAEVRWDLRDGVPVPDGSCSLIYCEHLLEHLTVEEGRAFLEACRRALAPGGTFRVAMPSLDHLLDKAAGPDWRDQAWLALPEYQFIRTRAEMVNICFRWWGHQWLYDREELHRRLSEAGFRTILDAAWGASAVAGLSGLETRPDSLLICEAQP